MKDNYILWIAEIAFIIMAFSCEGFLIGSFAFLVFLRFELIEDNLTNIFQDLVESSNLIEKIIKEISLLINKENKNG